MSEGHLTYGRIVPRAAEGSHYEVCPACRGYRLEASWCDFCQRTGMVLVKDKQDEFKGLSQ